MELKISVRSEIIVVIIIVLMIMMVHVLCSCSNVSLMEGFQDIKNFIKDDSKDKKKKKGVKEGFSSASTNHGNSSPYNVYDDTPVNTSSWFTPNLYYPKGAPTEGAQTILDRPPQPVPLPADELVLFSNTQFKPECCPNAYSTGSGCACMTVDQYKYLIHRGGNNVPYSEY
jgi:hypothetical protein